MSINCPLRGSSSAWALSPPRQPAPRPPRRSARAPRRPGGAGDGGIPLPASFPRRAPGARRRHRCPRSLGRRDRRRGRTGLGRSCWTVTGIRPWGIGGSMQATSLGSAASWVLAACRFAAFFYKGYRSTAARLENQPPGGRSRTDGRLSDEAVAQHAIHRQASLNATRCGTIPGFFGRWTWRSINRGNAGSATVKRNWAWGHPGPGWPPAHRALSGDRRYPPIRLAQCAADPRALRPRR